MKRAVDICLSLFFLALLSPLLLVIAVLCRCSMGNPVLFRQRRAGLHGRPFDILKFRTMTQERDAVGKLLADEARLTAFGRFLRASSLDELPELINVLRGEMSLIGPRPLLLRYVDRYTPEQRRRHDVRPGITGWAQVNGRNSIGWEQKFALDVWYIEHRSFWLDMRILAMTFGRVLCCRGISQPGRVTAAEFHPAMMTGDSDQRTVSDSAPLSSQ